MGNKAAYVTSKETSSEHGEVSTSQGSPNVYVEGKPIHRMTDSFENGHKTTSGSSTVFCNSLPVARIGDSTDCGGSIITGCTTVNVGG